MNRVVVSVAMLLLAAPAIAAQKRPARDTSSLERRAAARRAEIDSTAVRDALRAYQRGDLRLVPGTERRGVSSASRDSTAMTYARATPPDSAGAAEYAARYGRSLLAAVEAPPAVQQCLDTLTNAFSGCGAVVVSGSGMPSSRLRAMLIPAALRDSLMTAVLRDALSDTVRVTAVLSSDVEPEDESIRASPRRHSSRWLRQMVAAGLVACDEPLSGQHLPKCVTGDRLTRIWLGLPRDYRGDSVAVHVLIRHDARCPGAPECRSTSGASYDAIVWRAGGGWRVTRGLIAHIN